MKRNLTAVLVLFIVFSSSWASKTPITYVLTLSKGGSDTISFLAQLEEVKNGYRIVSDVKSDIFLEPASGSHPIDGKPIGPYILVLTDHRLRQTRFPVEAAINSGGIQVRGSGVILEMTPKELPTPSEASHWRSLFKMGDKPLLNLKKRVISRYGDIRTSEKRGHKHAGIDVRGEFQEPVYPLGTGFVLSVSNKFPESAVVIEHRLPGGDRLYSKYVHFGGIIVSVGQVVDEKTLLGNLFSREELKRSGFKTNHLHLEIRKTYSDKGSASSRSMTMKELNNYCIDPLEFLQKNLD